MKTQVSKWGHSLAVRIPQAYAEQLGVSDGSTNEIIAHGDSLTLRRATYALKDLLTKVTPDNLHPETNTGRPIGREEW